MRQSSKILREQETIHVILPNNKPTTNEFGYAVLGQYFMPMLAAAGVRGKFRIDNFEIRMLSIDRLPDGSYRAICSIDYSLPILYPIDDRN